MFLIAGARDECQVSIGHIMAGEWESGAAPLEFLQARP